LSGSIIVKKTTRTERPHVIGFRTSEAERQEIERLAAETGLGISPLMRYAFSLAKERIATAGSPSLSVQ
jgi:hypothetical protein